MVNFLFRQLMSRQLGEMEYTQEEALVPAAPYPERQDPDCEIHLLDAGDKATIAPPCMKRAISPPTSIACCAKG